MLIFAAARSARRQINMAKKKKQKRSIRQRKVFSNPFTFGNLSGDRSRLIVPVLLFVFSISTAAAFLMVKISMEKPVVIEETGRNEVLEREINKLVHGYPIEKMTPYIAMQDPKVAAFLVSIAKKESNWGKRKPVLDGKDCYNYWGFRLKTEDLGSGGHSCFDNPKEAVETVAARINELVNEEKLDTPKEMVVWKCGYGCQDGPSESKWIKDVNFYYDKLFQ